MGPKPSQLACLRRMGPKIRPGAKAKPTRKPASKAPSAIRGLAGFRKASAEFGGAVDKGVARQDAALASRAVVLPGLDARLVCVEPASGSDRYYLLQGLEDPRVPAGRPRRCYAFQRWGRTGTGGVCRLQGPMEQAQVEAHLFRVFKAKTGAAWGSPVLAGRATPGKYWPVTAAAADPGARWQFYSEPGGSSSKGSWLSCDPAAASQIEELYAEHKASAAGPNPVATRFVAAGDFDYQIDFDTLTQRNVATNGSRKIRRVLATSEAAAPRACRGAAPRDPPTETLPIRDDGSSASGSRGSSLKGPSSLDEMLSLVRSGEVQRLPAAALREWLRKHNISATGHKGDLMDRVHSLVW